VDAHEGHGPRNPSAAIPARATDSIRRTSSIDCHWPNGLGRDVIVIGRARDLRTESRDISAVIDDASVTAEIDYQSDRKVMNISSDPSIRDLDALIGVTAGPGFRRRVSEVAPKEREARSPLHLLLDDIPVALLVAAYALNQAGRSSHADFGFRVVANQCAGWASTGTMMQAVRSTGRTPLLIGPHAPLLESSPDLLALHPLQSLPVHGTRRLRLLDVSRVGDSLLCDAMFRDSYMSDELNESVVHEYGLSAKVDENLVVTDVVASPRVLPWEECPSAALSVTKIIGQHVSDLRTFVRETLTGTSTCTHLNDLLRSLDDVVALSQHV